MTPQFDDLSQITESVEFAYSDVDRNVFDVQEGNSTPEILILECQRRIWAWVYQPPCADLDGFVCRCILASWIFVPELRSYSMTQIAGRFGKKKQSLGRWCDDFKLKFPEIANHLQHLRHDRDNQH